MMKIKSLLLKNYRSYVKARFIFHKGINAIIGDGMSGKTNVFRSLMFLNTQRPVSKKHRRSNSRGPMKIRLKNDHGLVIGYENDKQPMYFISDGSNRQTFRKFGKNVPDAVQEAINLKDINFQDQISSPYVVTSAPSQITKIINQITRVEMVDKWLKKSNANVRYWNNIRTNTQEEISQIEYDLEPLNALDDLEPIMKNLHIVQNQVTKGENEYYEIERLISEIKHHKMSVKRFERVFEAEDVIKNHVIIDNKIDELMELSDLIIDFMDQLKDLEELESRKRKLSRLYMKQMKGVCPTCFQKIDIELIRKELK
jgi:predicted ATP-dependent endonuclease of OLD family